MHLRGKNALQNLRPRALREKYLLKENNLSQGPHGELVF